MGCTRVISARIASQKKSLTELLLSRTNRFVYTIRGATLNSRVPRALSRIQTYPRLLTPACSVATYSESVPVRHCSFDCALGSPFSEISHAAIPPPAALWCDREFTYSLSLIGFLYVLLKYRIFLFICQRHCVYLSTDSIRLRYKFGRISDASPPQTSPTERFYPTLRSPPCSWRSRSAAPRCRPRPDPAAEARAFCPL